MEGMHRRELPLPGPAFHSFTQGHRHLLHTRRSRPRPRTHIRAESGRPHMSETPSSESLVQLLQRLVRSLWHDEVAKQCGEHTPASEEDVAISAVSKCITELSKYGAGRHLRAISDRQDHWRDSHTDDEVSQPRDSDGQTHTYTG